MEIPSDLQDSVRCVDEHMVVVDDKMSTLPKAKQIEVWQYIADKAKKKYQNIRSEMKDEETDKVNDLVGLPLETKVVDEKDVVSKKRKLEYHPEWWRGYDKHTVEQMRQILKDNRELLPLDKRRGIGLDRKDVLRDKISGLRVILKKQAVLSFDKTSDT